MDTEEYYERECYGCGHEHVCTMPEALCNYYCPGCIAELDQDSAAIKSAWLAERASRWN